MSCLPVSHLYVSHHFPARSPPKTASQHRNRNGGTPSTVDGRFLPCPTAMCPTIFAPGSPRKLRHDAKNAKVDTPRQSMVVSPCPPSMCLPISHLGTSSQHFATRVEPNPWAMAAGGVSGQPPWSSGTTVTGHSLFTHSIVRVRVMTATENITIRIVKPKMANTTPLV
jgi:hypothetical protein